MHDAWVPQVGGKLFHTLACRVTSQSESWKPFYMPIMHYQVLMTNLFCPASPSFLICALFLDWRSQLGHWLTSSPIIQAPNWSLPFELICDASDYTVGALNGVATLWVIEYFVKRALNALLQKWAPPSLIITRGNPKRETMLLFKNSITTLWSLVLHGIASTYFDT